MRKNLVFFKSLGILSVLTAVTSTLFAGAIDIKSFQQPNSEFAEFAKKLDKDLKNKQEKRELIENHQIIKDNSFASVLNENAKNLLLDLNKLETSNHQENSPGSFYIFVSLTLKDKNLKALIEDATRYGGVMVLRGLKNDSMVETVLHLQRLLKNKNEGVIIDPRLFRKYKIDKVPAFVLTSNDSFEEGKEYDILKGNISARFALSKMKEKGTLKLIAARLLK